MWKGMYHSRWVIDRSRGKTWQHLIATIGAAMTFHGQESWIQATRMAVSLAVTLSTWKVQNRKPRLRQCCAVLRLSHSRVSEQSKLLRCWRTSHLMSHLSGRLSSIWWAVNHHLYLWTRFLACLACSHTFWCATLNLFPINLLSSHFCVTCSMKFVTFVAFTGFLSSLHHAYHYSPCKLQSDNVPAASPQNWWWLTPGTNLGADPVGVDWVANPLGVQCP